VDNIVTLRRHSLLCFWSRIAAGVLPSLPRAAEFDLATGSKSLSKGVGSSCTAIPKDIGYGCVARPNNHTQLNFLCVAFYN